MQKIVASLLMLLFCSTGLVKLTPKINSQAHDEQKIMFKKFAKVHPFALWFDYVPDADQYRTVIGYVELVCAVLLILGPAPLQVLNSVVLLTIMAGAVQTLYMVGERRPAMFAPAVATAVGLILNIYLLTRAPEEKIKKK